MKRIALFPGSFDPITKGHVAVLKQALPLFDEIVIAIGINSSKQTMFSLANRERIISKAFENESRVSIATYQGLTVEFCTKLKANYIIRGLRNNTDYEFEKNIAQMNKSLAPEIETLFFVTPPELAPVTSTIVRDILKHGGDVRAFLPEGINIADYK